MGTFKFLNDNNKLNLQDISTIWKLSELINGLNQEDKNTLLLSKQELSSQMIDSPFLEYIDYSFPILTSILIKYDFKINTERICSFINFFIIDIACSMDDFKEYAATSIHTVSTYMRRAYFENYVKNYEIRPEFLYE